MLICSVVDGRIPAAASHIGPRKGQYMRFQRSIRSIGRLSYTAMGRDESDFRLPPVSGGRMNRPDFPDTTPGIFWRVSPERSIRLRNGGISQGHGQIGRVPHGDMGM